MIEIPKLADLQPIIRDEKREEQAYARLRKSVRCSYCSMKATGSCVTCDTLGCAKHLIVYMGANYCRAHAPKLSGVEGKAFLDWETDDGAIPE